MNGKGKPLPLGIWQVNGVTIEITQGRHTRNDRVIHISGRGAGTAVRITMPTLGAIVGLLYRNEDVLYPPPLNQGGEKMLDFLIACCHVDLPEACLDHQLGEPVTQWFPLSEGTDGPNA